MSRISNKLSEGKYGDLKAVPRIRVFPEQYRVIKEQIRSVAQPLRLKRKISTAGKKPIVYLPEDVVKAINARVGDAIDIYVEGNRIVIEKTA